MSTSRGNRGDKGKGIAQDQSDAPPRSKRASTRRNQREHLELLSEQVAARMQAEEYAAANALTGMNVNLNTMNISQENPGPYFNTSLDDFNLSDEVQQPNFSSRTHQSQAHVGGESQFSGDEEEDDDVMPPPPPPQSQRSKTSNIFVKHFKKVEVKDPNSHPDAPKKFTVYCNYCNAKYKFTHGGGYGTFIKHMEKNHAVEFGIGSTQTQINFQPGPQTGSSQTGTQSLFKYDHREATDIMARYAAMQHLPFNSYDNERYEYSMKQAYNQSAKKISRSSVTRSIVKQCFNKKIELAKYLINLDHKVSICSDVWTDAYNKNFYMGITVHFVDNSWSLNKRLIAFKEFPSPHTAQAIAQLIVQVLNEYQLINKIFSVGFDNASANIASISSLIDACSPIINGRYFHVKCICHILNLCVQDALYLFNEYVEPIRKAVKLIHNKKVIGKKWQKYCHSKKIRYTTFSMDVSTRWNSTYDMINSTLEHKDYLVEFFRGFNDLDLVLLPNCWTQCMELFRLFKSFKTATVELSGVYYCTSVRVLEHCMYIALNFNSCMRKSSEQLQLIIFYMVQKWLKYFKEIPMVFLVAKCLDPKWKFGGVCSLLDCYYETLQTLPLRDLAQFSLDNAISLELDLPNIERIKFDLDNALRDLFKDYETKYNNDHQINTTSSRDYNFSNYGYLDIDYSDPIAKKVASLYSNTTHRGRANSELDVYLESRAIFQDVGPQHHQIDVLDWWSTHEKDYPILATMAKEIFAVPASTVAVEQAFSTAGCVLDELRSNMSTRNMEATMLLDDWSKAEMRAQEPDWDFRVESDVEEFTESETE